jgi:hypothetical protein
MSLVSDNHAEPLGNCRDQFPTVDVTMLAIRTVPQISTLNPTIPSIPARCNK